MPKTTQKTETQAVAKAFAHPIRGEILTALTERTASPTQLADDLDQDVRYLSYHVKLLREWGLIELVDEQPRRGATEHFYRATTRTQLDVEAWQELSPAMQQDNCGQVMKHVFGDYKAAVKGGTLTARPDFYAGRTLLDLDEEGWQEVSERIQEVAGDFLKLAQARSANRMAKSGAKPIRASASLLLFELPGRSGKR